MDGGDIRASLAHALAGGGSLDAETVNMACFLLARELDALSCTVPEAVPMAKRFLRIVGRIVIDTAAEGADPATWANTEEMVLQWVAEALRPAGYAVEPAPGSGRQPLADPAAGW
jgi:hypothetical protein